MAWGGGRHWPGRTLISAKTDGASGLAEGVRWWKERRWRLRQVPAGVCRGTTLGTQRTVASRSSHSLRPAKPAPCTLLAATGDSGTKDSLLAPSLQTPWFCTSVDTKQPQHKTERREEAWGVWPPVLRGPCRPPVRGELQGTHGDRSRGLAASTARREHVCRSPSGDQPIRSEVLPAV